MDEKVKAHLWKMVSDSDAFFHHSQKFLLLKTEPCKGSIRSLEYLKYNLLFLIEI